MTCAASTPKASSPRRKRWRKRRLRAAALEAGVTLVAPETVFLCADTKFGKDVTVEPYVVFGERVTVEDGALIRSFSHLAGAHVGKDATVGPFARLRPGTRLGDGVRIGNFVETKEAVIEAGAKANHLSYIGDASVGAGANIGAGTITCNYDGSDKHRTDIGAGRLHRLQHGPGRAGRDRRGRLCRIGLGDHGKRAGARSALWRAAHQVVKEGWAKRLQALKALGKKKPHSHA